MYRRADVRFHIGLAEAAHSPRLVAAMTEVQGQMSDLIERIAHPHEVLMRSNAQHERLLELLRSHDGGSAVRLMREHCAGTEHILAGLLPDAGERLAARHPGVLRAAALAAVHDHRAVVRARRG